MLRILLLIVVLLVACKKEEPPVLLEPKAEIIRVAEPTPLPPQPSPTALPAPATQLDPTENPRAELKIVQMHGTNFLVTWKFLPPKVGELFAVHVQATDAEGKPLTDPKLTVNATMPAHGHGMMTEPQVNMIAPGQWKIEGMKLHMHGTWELETRIEAAGRKERLTATWEQPPEAAE